MNIFRFAVTTNLILRVHLISFRGFIEGNPSAIAGFKGPSISHKMYYRITTTIQDCKPNDNKMQNLSSI